MVGITRATEFAAHKDIEFGKYTHANILKTLSLFIWGRLLLLDTPL